MPYHDFNLAIEQGADGSIALRSWCDKHGEYHDVATLDTTSLAHDRELLAGDQVARAELIALGNRLYGYTFASAGRNIEWHFGQCWGAFGAAPNGVRVRLRIATPTLAVIPWEFIYSERLRSFLGVSDRTPIVRYLELPQAIQSLETPLPVRVLVAIPAQPELDTATEKREILAALAPLGQDVQVNVLEGPVSSRTIADALVADEYHVFHFIGHGDFADDRAVLLMKGEDGSDVLVDQDRMAGLFRNHPTLKLVVLNSCRGAELSASKPFVGMGAELVKLGIPAVIAMQYEITDDEALCFSRTLYQSLFKGRDRGRIEIAVSHARNALAGEFPDTRAVGLPVLFMHTREGVLFDVVKGGTLRNLPISARDADRVKAVIKTRELNLDLIHAEQTGEHAASTPDGAGASGTGDVPSANDAAARLERLASAERDGLARARRLLRLRNVAIVIAVCVALVVGLAASFFGFRAVSPVVRPESYFIAFSDLFHHHDDEASVTYIAIDSATTRALGSTMDATWRSRHGAVVRNLVAAGAPVIAFNVAFPPNASVAAATDSLAEAFRLAQRNGRTILIAAEDSNGTPAIAPPIAPYAQWGTNCASDEDEAKLTAKVLTLATGKHSAGVIGRVPSLALTAVAALRASNGARGPSLVAAGDSMRSLLKREVLDSVVTTDTLPRCGLAPRDTLYRMALDYAPRHEHRAHHISYIDALQGRSLGDLRGRLVLVANERPDQTFKITRGLSTEQRFASELVADAMNTLLRGIRIAPVSGLAQFSVILAMAALGALAAFLWTRRGPWGAAIALAMGLATYFVSGAVLYGAQHTLLNTFFDLTALFLAFTAVVITRKVWFP